MGSLMAGWSTTPPRTEEAMKRSSSSLTKEEVEKFWRTKKLMMQEHLEGATKDAALSPRAKMVSALSEEIEAQRKLAEEQGLSTSLPETSPKAWWTKSRWAFLNDPPSEHIKESKYTPQFDVATTGQLTDHPSY